MVAVFQIRPVLQDGAQRFGSPATRQHRFERDLEMNQARTVARQQQTASAWIFNRSAAQGEYKRIEGQQAADSLVFQFTKPGFAPLLKYLRDGRASRGLNLGVSIEKLPG